jgi:hypothetical protein
MGTGRSEDAAETHPQPGDRFEYLTGPRKGQVVSVDSLMIGGAQVQAYPLRPDGTVRDETPLNLVIPVRFDSAELSEETRARAAEGVVAYSAICTHQALPGEHVVEGAQCFRLLMPRFGFRP